MFLGDTYFDPVVPKTKVRIVCSGDSFTEGTGVAPEHTWCRRLAEMDHRFEVVNMGVGGYGLDQAYLRYRRDGNLLEHHIHLFAFIADDLDRMKHREFWGYPKPVLRIENGALVPHNVPVPRVRFYRPKLVQAAAYIQGLKTAEFLQNLFNSKSSRERVTDDDIRALALRVFEELNQISKARGIILSLVLLPEQREYAGGRIDMWRQFFRTQTAKNGIFFVDLIDEYRAMPRAEAKELFLRGPSRVAGHLSVKGNRFIAQALYPKLLAHGGVA